jgi:excisionase family DNA binding protein
MTNFGFTPLALPKLPGRIMAAAELAMMLRVSPRTIRRLALRGRIPFFRVGAAMRFDSTRVLELMAAESDLDTRTTPGA